MSSYWPFFMFQMKTNRKIKAIVRLIPISKIIIVIFSIEFVQIHMCGTGQRLIFQELHGDLDAQFQLSL